MPDIFNVADTKKTPRSVFNLSHTFTFTCDVGQLIPVLALECIPSDRHRLGNLVKIRIQPMIAPALHELNAYVHYFFVPNRLVMNRDTMTDLSDTGTWEDFITGGRLGTDATTIPEWDIGAGGAAIGDLYDYLHGVVGIRPLSAHPKIWGQRGYNLIWNQYYRNQNVSAEIALDGEDLLYRMWEKDYFTSALPWTARGTEPALPVTITGDGGDVSFYNSVDSSGKQIRTVITTANVDVHSAPTGTGYARWYDPGLSASSFDVNDMRLAVQQQIFLERNARAGARYNEFLRAHFNGISNGDARLNRAEYIGGSKAPLVISEVLQTESSDATTPQGTMAGHGITVDSRNIGTYTATEFGWIFGILSIMPRTSYSQGIAKKWRRDTKYDYPFPEFAGLGEQEVLEHEIVASGTGSENETVFGFQGRYNELRYEPSRIAGEIRTQTDGGNLYYWSLGREFGSRPTLNESFCSTSGFRKDWLAVPGEPAFIVHIANLIQSVRPLPIAAVPGGMDHA